MRVFELIDKTTGEVAFAGRAVDRHWRCPVCGKPDWCLRDAQRELTICPRTISERKIGEAGYLHADNQDAFDRRHKKRQVVWTPKVEPRIDFSPMAEQCQRRLSEIHELDDIHIDKLAANLGVSEASLAGFEVGWSDEWQAYTFPMRDDKLNVIGIRLRSPDGHKFAVRGSRNGLFIPMSFYGVGPICIEEGPTSAAALSDLGYDCIGRPSCSAGVDMLVRYLRQHKSRPIVIVANNDATKTRPDGSTFRPGIDGAAVLADEILRTGASTSVKVIVPARGKDSRDWLRTGVKPEKVKFVINNAPMWRLCGQAN